jgi:type I restriction enzyme S subunit
VLLERIRAEKEELIKAGKIKRDKKESVIFKGEDNSYYLIQNGKSSPVDETIVFDLPELWEWTTIPTIANVELGKTLDRAKNTGTLYPYLRSVNIQWGDIDLSDLNEMRFEDDELEKYSVIKTICLFVKVAMWDELLFGIMTIIS